jgi:hypothetical protein
MNIDTQDENVGLDSSEDEEGMGM